MSEGRKDERAKSTPTDEDTKFAIALLVRRLGELRAEAALRAETPAPREELVLLLPRKEFDKLGDDYVRLSEVLAILRAAGSPEQPK